MQSTENASEDAKKSGNTPISLASLILVACIAAAAKLVHDASLLRSELALERMRLNVSALADRQDRLFFNRVPKVGSQTMMGLIQALGKRHGFTHYVDDVEIKNKGGERTYLNRDIQRTYVDMFRENLTVPFSYSKHISYIDFESFGAETPIYINMVREPVQRVISWYYYVREARYLFKTGPDGNYSRKACIYATKDANE